jgi:hypothetical protein
MLTSWRAWRVPMLAAALTLDLGAEGARAQAPAHVRGVVTDTAGVPIAGAVVAALGDRHASVATGPTGGFALRLPPGAERVAAAGIGFFPETLAATTEPLTFRLRPAPVLISPIAVAADRSFSAAGSALIRRLDVALRPTESSQDLLRLVPGLVIAQHAGGGKAEQIFLRGFDADHGTDVAISVDGTPVNVVSHAHGQGYADLHFLIPETVSEAEVRKGPYDVADGDFATAGAVAFHTLDRVPFYRPRVEVRGGSFGMGRVLGLLPLGGETARQGGYLAAAGHYSDGPFDAPQRHGRVNLFAKWTAPLGSSTELVATASCYGARWNASGQIPERAVMEGQIGRFGSLDPTEGGLTDREEVAIGVRSTGGVADWDARAYVAHYGLKLYSNFTFFLRDSVDGDGIVQTDDRIFAGFGATYARAGSLLGRPGRWDVGVGGRFDAADVGLSRQVRRRLLGGLVDDRIRQGHLWTWARHSLVISSRLRAEFGVRADLFRFGVTDRLVGVDTVLPHGSGAAWKAIVNPKVSLAYGAASGTELFANAATGFHSNDARDVILSTDRNRVLPRAAGIELGVRHTWTTGSVAVSLWRLDLESELVYVGDEGFTESVGRTRRHGLDLEGRLRLAPWLWADVDLNLARGRLRDEPVERNRVPLAPRATSTGGLTVRGAGPVRAGARYRFVGDRPATEDGSIVARGHLLFELFASWRLGRLELVAAVDNLLDAESNESQFATTSRLAGEREPVTELHFTPGAGRTVTVGVRYGGER